jgi:CheY-like chemotaxis protein
MALLLLLSHPGHNRDVIRRSISRALRILVIDDNEAVLDVVALLLLRDGHTVLIAPDGRQGLARLEAGEAVDLVLTDFALPDINGFEVVHRVRSRWPRVRVGIMTGMIEEFPKRHEPIDLLLRKPVNLYELRETVKRLRLPAR